MFRCTRFALALACVVLSADASAEGPTSADIRTEIARSTFGERALSADLSHFYRARRYAAAWQSDGNISESAGELVRVLTTADEHGLLAAAYWADELADALSKGYGRMSATSRARLDLLLTEAFFKYARHQLGGRVTPTNLYSDWEFNPRLVNLPALLHRGLATSRLGDVLARLPPSHPEYARLRAALAHLRGLSARGGWPSVSVDATLRYGDRDRQIILVKERLIASGDLQVTVRDSVGVFDDVLERAIRDFQERHGLEVDGIIGPATTAALDVTTDRRIRSIELNLERWRWQPAEFGSTHLRVDASAFSLVLIHEGSAVFSGRAIVGTRANPTPVFSSIVTHVELSPSWYVPPSIARAEILPQLRRSPGYLARNDMVLLSGGRTVDPLAVDWHGVPASRFPYQIRQRPGPLNRLGPMKLIFENRFGVRIHGTPNPSLFELANRALSYGCIRVEEPLALSRALLRDEHSWTQERIEAVVRARRETIVQLTNPVPVHVLYFTARVDERGRVHFPVDVYQRDAVLERELERFREQFGRRAKRE
jgi:L,D-transpeptidase YcbB